MPEYIETQKYSDCQLVAAQNAAIHLKLPLIPEGEYEAMVDAIRARHGAALNMKPVFERLGIVPLMMPLSINVVKAFLTIGIPICFNVHSLEYGNHTIAAVEFKAVGRGYRVLTLNFNRDYTVNKAGKITRRFKDGWIPWKRIEKISLKMTDYSTIQRDGRKCIFAYMRKIKVR